MYNKRMACKLPNTNPFSGAGITSFFEINLACHADLHQNGGFLVYPVSSKRESRYDEECVTENIAPGIIAHLALHRSGVLCKGALFYIGKVRAGHEPY